MPVPVPVPATSSSPPLPSSSSSPSAAPGRARGNGDQQRASYLSSASIPRTTLLPVRGLNRMPAAASVPRTGVDVASPASGPGLDVRVQSFPSDFAALTSAGQRRSPVRRASRMPTRTLAGERIQRLVQAALALLVLLRYRGADQSRARRCMALQHAAIRQRGATARECRAALALFCCSSHRRTHAGCIEVVWRRWALQRLPVLSERKEKG